MLTKKELFSAGEKKEGVSIDYSYTSTYGKETYIEIEGSLFLVGETKKLKESLKTLKAKSKKNYVNSRISVTLCHMLGITTLKRNLPNDDAI